MRKTGRSILYSINKEHILIKEFLSTLFSKEKRILSWLMKLILENVSDPQPLSIILFGSQIDPKTARPDSDFDLLIILPEEKNLNKFKKEVARSEMNIKKFFGNTAALLIMKKSEYLKRKKKGDSLLLSIEKKNMVLFGKHLREIK